MNSYFQIYNVDAQIIFIESIIDWSRSFNKNQMGHVIRHTALEGLPWDRTGERGKILHYHDQDNAWTSIDNMFK